MRIDVAWDWTWSDGYLPEVRRILSQNALHLVGLSVATFHQDVKEATDMLVTVGGSKGIAVRLRRAMYGYRDLTIRAFRSSGTQTELEKIKAGRGDFYLYGWTDGMRIPEWMLVDLQRLRQSRLLDRQWRTIENTERMTGFIAIPYTALLSAGCLVNYCITSAGR